MRLENGSIKFKLPLILYFFLAIILMINLISAVEITNLYPAGQSFNTSDTIDINATASDGDGIDTVLANITYPNGTLQQLTLTNTSTTSYNSSFTIPKVAGQFNITIIANDTLGNLNNTEETNFIAEIEDPTSLVGLRAWYDAADNTTLYTDESCTTTVSSENQEIRCWQDKSDYSANATNVSGKGVPEFTTNQFNGHSVVNFSKSESDTLRHVIPSQYTSDFTIFAVIQSRDSSPETFESFFSNGQPADTNHFQIDYTNDSGVNSFRYGSSTKFNFETFSNEIKLYSVTHNGSFVHLYNEGQEVNNGSVTEGRVFEHYRINQNRNGDRHHDSRIGEIIIYDRVLSACEQEEIDIHLGEKYGRDFFGISDNYGYGVPHNNDVNGIGEFTSVCVSSKEFTSAQSSIATISNPSSLDIGDSLTFGHNDAGFTLIDEAPANYSNRINQSWRVDKDNEPGNVSVSFDLSSTSISAVSSDFALLIDSDTDFSDAIAHLIEYSISENTVTFTQMNFSDGQYFTLAVNEKPPAIEFVDPTPSNGSAQDEESFVINLSSNAFGDDHYAFVDFENTLRFWMRMDDVNASGDPTDLGSRDFNGTLQSGASINETGKFGDAAHFDGTNDYIDLPDMDINFSAGFTLCAWTYWNSFTESWSRIIDFGQGQADDNILFAHQGTTTNLAFEVYNGGTGGNQVVATGVLQTGVWQHLCAIENSSGYTELYVSGANVQNGTANVPSEVTRNNAYIGRSNWGGDGYFDGAIDEVLIFNRTLELEEISSLYNASANQYTKNFASLTKNKNYTFTGYAVSANGEKNQTETRIVTIGTTPFVNFSSPTPADSSFINQSNFNITLNSNASGKDNYVFVDFDNSLVLWMRMDDVNASGDPTDLSSHSNNGSLGGDASINSTGRFGNSLHLDGDVDNIEISDDSSLKFGTEDFTYSLWFKADSVPSSTEQLFCKRTNSAGNYEVQIESGGKIRAWIGDVGGTATNIDSQTTISADTWYQVTITRGEGNLSMYVNGALENQTSSTHNVTSSSVLRLGQDTGGSTEYFDGAIDEVLIFNRSLNPSEISSLYNATFTQYTNNFTLLGEGNHTFIGYVVSSNGNKNQTETRTITIDTLTPNGTLLTPLNATVSNNITRNLTANISDDTDLSNVTLFIYNESNDLINQTTISVTGAEAIVGTVYNFVEGIFTWFYKIIDRAGNTFFTGNNTITIDTTPPTVIGLTPLNNTGFYEIDTIEISANISDTIEVNSVFANITYPNSTIKSITLINSIDDKYNASFTIPSLDGFFTVKIVANDTASNINDSEIISFNNIVSSPGGIGANLTLWLDASKNGTLYQIGCSGSISEDSDSVGCWQDRSGNGYNFTENGTQRPLMKQIGVESINFNPVIDLDGINDFLEDSDGESYINGVSGFTFISVTKSRITGTDRGFLTTDANVDDNDDEFAMRYDVNGADGGGTNVMKVGINTTVGGPKQIESQENIQTTEPQILAMDWNSGSTIRLFIHGGNTTHTSDEGPMSGTIQNSDSVIVGRGTKISNHYWNGSVAEIIYYNERLNATARQKVESYLAIKYGITLNETIDYVSSNGTVIYNSTGSHINYTSDIAGIGREDDSGLNQTKSQSVNSDSIIIMYNASSPDSGEFILWGNDNGSLSETNIEIPFGMLTRLSRIWKVDLTGDLGNVSVEFNLTGLDITGKNASDFQLIINSANANFSSVDRVYAAANLTNNITIFHNVDFVNRDFFTLSTSRDDNPPNVTALLPISGNQYNQTEAIEVRANATDISNVSAVIGNILLPNGTYNNITLINQTAPKYNQSFTQNLIGLYNLTIFANDTLNNLNNSEKSDFRRTTGEVIDFIGFDYLPLDIDVNITGNSSGILNLTVTVNNFHPFSTLTITGFNSSASSDILLFLSNESGDLDEGFNETFVIDTSRINYDNLTATINVSGDNLFQCSDVNQSTLGCLDIYSQIAEDMNDTQSITLSPGTYVFGTAFSGPDDIGDTTLRENNPNNNYGTQTNMRVGRQGNSGSKLHRIAIRFNITNIPERASVTNAQLRLYFYDIPGSDTNNPVEFGVHKVQQSPARDWGETTATWNSYNETSWTSTGGDFNATATDIINISSAEEDDYVYWNVTDDVANFVLNQSENFGWIIKTVNETTGKTRRYFRTKEYSNEDQRPELILNYTITNYLPNISQVILNTTTGSNNPDENLTIHIINATDNDNDTIINITNWYRNNKSLAALYLPFEGNNNESKFTNDYSGHNQNTTVNEANWYRTGGKIGGAYEFDGVNDNIEISYNQTLNITREITLEAWAKTKDTNHPGGDPTVIGKIAGNGQRAFFLGIDDDGGDNDDWVFSMSSNCNNFPGSINVNNAVDNNGVWQHIVGTWNGTEMKLYKNGIEIGSDSFTGPICDIDLPIQIGESVQQEGFEGFIDEVKIYNFSLTPEQIYRNFLEGNASLPSKVIVSNETNLDETWHACVTPNDGFTDGNTTCSNVITITEGETISPNVTLVNATPSSTFNLNAVINISANASDGTAVDSVLANITLPNDTINQITLIQNTGDKYNGTYTAPGLIGSYTVRIIANDTFNNINNSETTTFEIENSIPSVSNAEINNGNDITLTSGTNTATIGEATITDLNGYGDISNVTGYFFLTTVGAGIADNKSSHYTSTCIDNGDGAANSISYNCTFNITHYAVPTDSGSNNSNTHWTFIIAPLDDQNTGTNGTDVVEIDTLLSFDISPSIIDFGNLNLGTNTTSTNKIINITNMGNVGIDLLLSGTNLSCDPGIVPVDFLEYEDNPFSYGIGVDLLESSVELDLDARHGYESNETPIERTYYGLGIPGSSVGGSCSGSIILTGQSDPHQD